MKKISKAEAKKAVSAVEAELSKQPAGFRPVRSMPSCRRASARRKRWSLNFSAKPNST